jgi:choline monooxygenase
MTIDRTDPYTRLNARPIPTEDYTREETYRHTRVPVDLAVTLIPDAYTSREFFDVVLWLYRFMTLGSLHIITASLHCR